MLKRLLGYLLYGGHGKLRQYEQACIDRLKAQLRPDGASRLERQLSLVERIQRFSNDRLVVFNYPEDSKDTVPLFPNRSEECRAVRIRLRPASGRMLTADVVFHLGRLSSLEYSRDPRKPLGDAFSVESAEVTQDMMVETPSTDSTPLKVQPGSLLAEIGRGRRLEQVVGPAPDLGVSALVSMRGAVPADYTALLRETDGFAVGDWRFMGTRARRVILPNKTLWLVAETGEFALCFAEGSAEPVVLFYDQIDDECREAGRRFVPALLEAVSSTRREP